MSPAPGSLLIQTRGCCLKGLKTPQCLLVTFYVPGSFQQAISSVLPQVQDRHKHQLAQEASKAQRTEKNLPKSFSSWDKARKWEGQGLTRAFPLIPFLRGGEVEIGTRRTWAACSNGHLQLITVSHGRQSPVSCPFQPPQSIHGLRTASTPGSAHQGPVLFFSFFSFFYYF